MPPQHQKYVFLSKREFHNKFQGVVMGQHPTKHPKTEAKISIFFIFSISEVKKEFKMSYFTC